MKVLIVDADPVSREQYRKVLERDGFSCTVAENDTQALLCLRRAAFEVALLDWKTPLAAGLATLVRLRAEAPGMAVVIITAQASIDGAVTAVKAGAFDYLPRSSGVQALPQRIRRAGVAARKALEEAFIQRELVREQLSRTLRQTPAGAGRVARLIQAAGHEAGTAIASSFPASQSYPPSLIGGDAAALSSAHPAAVESATKPAPDGDRLARAEATEIDAALRQCQGNKTRAAALLGINRKTLREKMRKYAITYSPGPQVKSTV